MGYSTRSKNEEVSLVGRVFEDLCEEGLIVECMDEIKDTSLVMNEFSTKEEMHVKLTSKKRTKGEEYKENQVIYIEKSPEEVQEEDSPMNKPFNNHFGILSTK